MWGLDSLAVMAMMAVAGVEGSSALPGLSWCAETTTIDNLKITKDEKPELGQIEVVVNDYIEKNVVDEVFLRKEPQCESFEDPQTAVIDWEKAELVMQDDGDISMFWKPPDTIPIFQKIDNFCITNKNSENPEDQSTNFATLFAKFCFLKPLLQQDHEWKFCSNVNCVRKCCPEGMSLIGHSSCGPVGHGEDWLPDAMQTTVLHGPPRLCPKTLIYHNFSFLPSGMIELDGSLEVGFHGYCVEQIGDPPSLVAMVRITPDGVPHSLHAVVVFEYTENYNYLLTFYLIYCLLFAVFAR